MFFYKNIVKENTFNKNTLLEIELNFFFRKYCNLQTSK